MDCGLWTVDFPQPLLTIDPLIIQPPVIAHPARVDRVVLARLVAIDFVFARTDDDIAGRRAARAKAFGLFEKPDAHLKTKVLGGERADRTNVRRVEGVIVV